MLIKTQAKKMLGPILPSFQAYQSNVIFNLCDDDWKDLSFEHAQILIQKMMDTTTEPI
jgi:hypothetical protein